ncbi:hypothetical protein ABZ837_00255 [Streptomyces sp. NPDC047197]|uniref:hypothetical protein n=1 Tax=Streptomyces sp. NPDC047197 TaxID=3155477 RepID=UPI0033E50963
MRRDAVDLASETVSVHPDHSALHEISGHHSYGPPKTAASVRTVTLSPFFAALLTQDLLTHRRDRVFTTDTGKLLRRSTPQRRSWALAGCGCTLSDHTVWKLIKSGLTFHGLRQFHKPGSWNETPLSGTPHAGGEGNRRGSSHGPARGLPRVSAVLEIPARAA